MAINERVRESGEFGVRIMYPTDYAGKPAELYIKKHNPFYPNIDVLELLIYTSSSKENFIGIACAVDKDTNGLVISNKPHLLVSEEGKTYSKELSKEETSSFIKKHETIFEDHAIADSILPVLKRYIK